MITNYGCLFMCITLAEKKKKLKLMKRIKPGEQKEEMKMKIF